MSDTSHNAGEQSAASGPTNIHLNSWRQETGAQKGQMIGYTVDIISPDVS